VALLVALLAVLAIGCGEGTEDEDDTLVNALGGSGADAEQLDAVVDAIGPFAETQATFVAAMREPDLSGAVDAAAQMEDQIDEGLRLTSELDSAEVRGTFEDYLRPAQDYVDAGGAVVAYQDQSRRPPRVATARRLVARLEKTEAALRAADRNLIDRLMAGLPEDERDDFQDALGDTKERQREIIGGE
jgi:hypothetical protein